MTTWSYKTKTRADNELATEADDNLLQEYRTDNSYIVVDINPDDWDGAGALTQAAGTYALTSYTNTFALYIQLYLAAAYSSIPAIDLETLVRMNALSQPLSLGDRIGLLAGKIRTPEFAIDDANNLILQENASPYWIENTKNSTTWSQPIKNTTTWASPTKN